MDLTVQSADLERLLSSAAAISRGDAPVRIVAERIGESIDDTGPDQEPGAPETGQLRLVAFNDTLVSEWRCAATIRMSGRAAIIPDGLDRLVKASKAADSSIDMSISGTDTTPSLRLTTSRSAHEFPLAQESVFETVDPGRIAGAPANLSNLAAAISVARTAAAARAEAAGARMVLTGVHLRMRDDHIDVVGTDGRRLALSRLAPTTLGAFDIGLDTAGLTLPPESLGLLNTMLGDGQTRIARHDNALVVDTPSGIVSLRLLDMPFPDYTQLLGLPTTHAISLPRADLEIALSRSSANLSKDQRSVTVKLSRGADGLHLSSTASGQTSSECLDTTPGEACEIGFDARYMLTAIGVFPKSRIDICFDSPTVPIRLTSEDRPDVTMLVMPCRTA